MYIQVDENSMDVILVVLYGKVDARMTEWCKKQPDPETLILILPEFDGYLESIIERLKSAKDEYLEHQMSWNAYNVKTNLLVSKNNEVPVKRKTYKFPFYFQEKTHRLRKI